MPSTSPGDVPESPTPFLQILPGAPSASLQTVACFSFRQRHYVAYTSGRQLNLLSGPNVLVQCLSFHEDLVAVSAEPGTGRLALAGKTDAWVIAPVTEGWKSVRWEKSLYLRRDDPGDEARTLSWGIEDEVLVGGNRKLSLFSTLPSSPADAATSTVDGGTEERRTLWCKSIPSPLQYATFSPSGTLIATSGIYDRLVKIWRRLSFEEGLFDYMYLPHPTTVTCVQWRPSQAPAFEPEDEIIVAKQDDDLEVLYTIANDGILRVWKTGAAHDLEILGLHTTVDLVSAVPDSPSLSLKDAVTSKTQSARYTCILPADQFCAAINTAIGVDEVKNNHSSEHLREIASKEPEVAISFDGRGRMSAWGIHSIGHKRRPETPTESPHPIFHIAHAEDLPLRIAEGVNVSLQAWCEGRVFNLIEHNFEGAVRWWRGDVQDFFSLSFTGPAQLSEAAYWSGHSGDTIHMLAASSPDRKLLSTSAAGDTVLWEAAHSEAPLTCSAHMRSENVVKTELVSSIHASPHPVLVAKREAAKKPASGITLSLRDSHGAELDKISKITEDDCDDQHWQLFVSEGSRTSCKRCVLLNTTGKGFSCVVDTMSTTFHAECDLHLPSHDTSDPLQYLTAILDSDDHNMFGVVSLAQSGALVLYHVQSSMEGSVDAALVAIFQSGIVKASILASSNDFAIVASSDGSELVIVNLTDGYIEHRLRPGKKIRQAVLSRTDSIVAVINDVTIDVFAQGRIGYREEMPPWVLIKQISIAGLGLTIDSVAWLGDGGLAVAAGGVIFVSSNSVDIESLEADVREATGVEANSPKTLELATVAKRLRKPIPVWHPTFVAHIVRFGQWSLAASLVSRLLQKVKFWSEGDVLPSLLNVPASQLYGAEGVHDEKVLDRDVVNELMEQLEEKDLPQISHSEQRRLQCVLQAMVFCSEHVKGLDNLALRYLYSWKMELLLMEAKHPSHASQTNGDLPSQQAVVPLMHWREVAFAFHSTSQQPLLDVLMGHYDGKITWEIARRLGLFAWLSDREALDQIFDALAQTAYRSTSPPDPINASLYFLALHKKQTLLGLWRIATWHKEQRPTLNFLRRDFTLREHQTAAKKNAYALMGKRRFEYAAAFFLLANDGASAVSVLAGQCGDIMLAIAVGRLFSGDTSPALRKLVEDRLIPEAKQKNDRWLLNWCYSLLLDTERATFALVRPLDGVRDWHQDDPALLNLFQRLRKMDSEYEFEAVLRAARILRRMGLWLIALELVSQWEFLRTKPAQATFQPRIASGASAEQPSSILDEFIETSKQAGSASLIESPAVKDEKSAREAKAAELLRQIKAKKEGISEPSINEKQQQQQQQQQPTQFQEPDANSLLDSFGF